MKPYPPGDLSKASRGLGVELLGREAPKREQPLGNRRLVRRLQAIDQLPRRDQQALLRTIDAFLKSARTG